MLHEQKGKHYKTQANTQQFTPRNRPTFPEFRVREVSDDTRIQLLTQQFTPRNRPTFPESRVREVFDDTRIQLLTFDCVLSNNCWGLNQAFAGVVNRLCK